MSGAIAEIPESIKHARAAKGFTQRQLGERVGLPQSHISKIESGAVDLQLSSLIEIARALDLELKLVPRKTLPAIESVVRSQRERHDTSRALTTIAETSRFAERIRENFPSVTQVNEFQKALNNIEPAYFDPETLRDIQEALQPVANLGKHLQDLGWALEDQVGTRKLVRQIQNATRALQKIRNLQSNATHLENAPRLPAYRLEEDDE